MAYVSGSKSRRHRLSVYDGDNKEYPTPPPFTLEKKKAASAPAPAPAPASAPAAAAPAPKPKSKPEPIEHSPEIQQAKERVDTFKKNDLLSGNTADEIFQVEPTQDFFKDTYISTSDNQSNDRQYDFSAKTFNADTKMAQDFLTRKLSNYTNSVPPVDIGPV